MPRVPGGPWPALLAAVVLTATAVTACTSQGGPGHRTTGARSAPDATASHRISPYNGASGSGCEGTPVRRGDPPSWAAGEQHGFSGPTMVPYAVSARTMVIAYLWGYPLASHTTSRRDKILWFVKHGTQSLHVHGHPVDATTPVLSTTISGGGPDGMPSYVKAPAPGCWRLDLAWKGPDGSHHDTITLRYVAHR